MFQALYDLLPFMCLCSDALSCVSLLCSMVCGLVWRDICLSSLSDWSDISTYTFSVSVWKQIAYIQTTAVYYITKWPQTHILMLCQFIHSSSTYLTMSISNAYAWCDSTVSLAAAATKTTFYRGTYSRETEPGFMWPVRVETRGTFNLKKWQNLRFWKVNIFIWLCLVHWKYLNTSVTHNKLISSWISFQSSMPVCEFFAVRWTNRYWG